MPSTILAARLRRIPVIATGAFLALSVPDLDASADCNSEKLGLKITMRELKTNGCRHGVSRLLSGHFPLAPSSERTLS